MCIDLSDYLKFFLTKDKTFIITGTKIMFITSSKIKLPPTRPKNIYATVFLKPKEVPHFAISPKKKIEQPKRKTPVFTIGATIAAKTAAKTLFFF